MNTMKMQTEHTSLFAALRQRGEELKALPEGWDSYEGKRIDAETVDKSIDLAMALAPLFPSYPPQLVPTDGDVSVEWHVDGWDVEMWVSRARQT